MAWPPAVLPINRTNATPQLDTHAADHNALAQAMNDTTTKLTTVSTDVANLKTADVVAPAGLIGLAERTTTAGPVATATGIGGLVATVTLASRRMLGIGFYARQYQTPAAGDYGFIQLRLNGAVVEDGLYMGIAGGGVNAPAMKIDRFVIAAPGTHTIEVWAAPSISTVTLIGTTAAPMFLAVHDWGDRP